MTLEVALFKRNKNPDGSIGGWVADTAYVAPTARVDRDAWVYEQARVEGNAWVAKHAKVHGEATLRDNALVGDRADVSGASQISENGMAVDDAVLGDRARISENGQVLGKAQIFGDIHVSGNAEVSGKVILNGDKTFAYTEHMDGSELHITDAGQPRSLDEPPSHTILAMDLFLPTAIGILKDSMADGSPIRQRLLVRHSSVAMCAYVDMHQLEIVRSSAGGTAKICGSAKV